MEAIVLVSVLTSSAKTYDLGPLEDSYPARRRPLSKIPLPKFRYQNVIMLVMLPSFLQNERIPTKSK